MAVPRRPREVPLPETLRRAPDQAQQPDRADRRHPEHADDGVHAGASRAHLMELARELEINGRSRMRKEELVGAIRHAHERMARQTRGRD